MMDKSKYSWINLLFLLCFAYAPYAHAQKIVVSDSKTNTGFSKDRLERLDARMHQFVDKGQLSGVQTLIYRSGKIVHFDTYGNADIESETALDDNSMWRIYSMTKPIVSVGLMMLYEQGLFNLNDPVSDYIPAFNEMTVYTEEHGIQPAKNTMKIIDY